MHTKCAHTDSKILKVLRTHNCTLGWSPGLNRKKKLLLIIYLRKSRKRFVYRSEVTFIYVVAF